MLEHLIETDKLWLLCLNGHHSPFFDSLMFAVSGRPEWIPLYMIILGFLIWKYRWRTLWILLAVAVLITLTDQFANLLKAGVMRPRPCRDPEIGHLVHRVNNYCGGAYGFVSGHAANSFALATIISLLFRKKWVTTGLLIWASLVSYSRIYLGVHYPGDILGGALIGVFLGGLIYALFDRMVRFNKLPGDSFEKFKREE
jgi:undecaprenyl-diphosphatase